MMLAGPGAPQSSHVASLESQPSWDSRCPPVPFPTRSNAVAGSVPRILSPARHVAIAHSVRPVASARGHRTPAAPMDSTVGWAVNHTLTTGGATTTTMANCARTTQEVDLKVSRQRCLRAGRELLRRHGVRRENRRVTRRRRIRGEDRVDGLGPLRRKRWRRLLQLWRKRGIARGMRCIWRC